MAIFYHLNHEGQPSVCRARLNADGTIRACPYGTQEEHYSSEDDARAAYERSALEDLMSLSEPSETVGDLELARMEKAYRLAQKKLRSNPFDSDLAKKTQRLKSNRDAIASRLGLPNIDETDRISRMEMIAKRNESSQQLSIMRKTIASNDVGPNTDRERLYQLESELLKQYINDPSSSEQEFADRWIIQRSVSLYEIENGERKLERIRSMIMFRNTRRQETERIKNEIIKSIKNLREAEDHMP